MRGEKKTSYCVLCGKPFKVRTGATHSNKYCSFACYRKARQERHKCVICGKQAKRDKRGDRWWKTCSEDCAALYRSKVAHQNKCAHPFPSGENNPNWRGGKTEELKAIKNTVAYSQWRIAVFSRDNFTCQRCGKRGGNLEPHHIMPFATYPELRFDIGNGQTLCRECHKKTESYGANSRNGKCRVD